MRRFEDFLGHEYDVIAQMAELLMEAETGLRDGTITQSEFNELATGILEFANIDELTNEVDKKLIIQEGIDTLRFILDHLPMV